VPAKPRWLSNLDHIVGELERHPKPFIDRATVEFLLGVGRRRAQQIMTACVTDRVGANHLADRNALLAHLHRLAEGDDAEYEVQRRRRVATVLDKMRTERLAQPQLLVEAPTSVVNQDLADLPAGVRLDRGRITVEFRNPQQALEKLLALAMAISNDFESFEQAVRT
jgi:hypothetical protein